MGLQAPWGRCWSSLSLLECHRHGLPKQGLNVAGGSQEVAHILLVSKPRHLGSLPRPPRSCLSIQILSMKTHAKESTLTWQTGPTVLSKLHLSLGLVRSSVERCDSGTSKWPRELSPLSPHSQSPGSPDSPKTRIIAAKVQKAPSWNPDTDNCDSSWGSDVSGLWIQGEDRLK